MFLKIKSETLRGCTQDAFKEFIVLLHCEINKLNINHKFSLPIKYEFRFKKLTKDSQSFCKDFNVKLPFVKRIKAQTVL